MGNLNARLVYIPGDFSRHRNIQEILSQFKLIKREDVLAIIEKKFVQEYYMEPPLDVICCRIRSKVSLEYQRVAHLDTLNKTMAYFESSEHDCHLAKRLMGELKPFVKSMSVISKEISDGVVCLESDPTVQMKVEDLFRLMAYNVGLSEAHEEFDNHLSMLKKE